MYSTMLQEMTFQGVSKKVLNNWWVGMRALNLQELCVLWFLGELSELILDCKLFNIYSKTGVNIPFLKYLISVTKRALQNEIQVSLTYRWHLCYYKILSTTGTSRIHTHESAPLFGELWVGRIILYMVYALPALYY